MAGYNSVADIFSAYLSKLACFQIEFLKIRIFKNFKFHPYTTTKRSNAQHLVEYEKQLLYEENKKSGNVMQLPMDSYICGINTSSESILIRSYLLVA